MAAQLRESFLRELMILQSQPTTSIDKDDKNESLVDILLLSELSQTGRQVSANFIACDTNLTHVLVKNLNTPIGTQPSALIRLKDVIAISYN